MIIYKITNLIDGKIYIGQTIRTIKERWKQHLRSNGCCAISAAIKKYGEENFIIEIVDSALSIDELNKKETEWIITLQSLAPHGYNLNTGGNNRRFSQEVKEKISKSHVGKKLCDDHKLKISRSTREFFKHNPDKHIPARLALKDFMKKSAEQDRHPKKGKKVAEEGRKNISNSKLGAKNPMFGKKSNKNQLQALAMNRQSALAKLPSVLCHQNKKIYQTVTEAAKDLGFARSSISNVLTGFRDNCGGYTFEYVRKYES